MSARVAWIVGALALVIGLAAGLNERQHDGEERQYQEQIDDLERFEP